MIRFENVSFSYAGNAQEGLEPVDLTIDAFCSAVGQDVVRQHSLGLSTD